MTFNFKTIIAAAAVSIVPLAAHAIPIAPGSMEGEAFFLQANGEQSFSYEPTQRVRVSVISMSGTGFNDTADLAKVMFGINGATQGYAELTDNGDTSSATGLLPSFVTADAFTLDYSAFGTQFRTQNTFSFVVSDVAPIPVPAAGGMLLLAVAGGAALKRRKQKAA